MVVVSGQQHCWLLPLCCRLLPMAAARASRLLQQALVMSQQAERQQQGAMDLTDAELSSNRFHACVSRQLQLLLDNHMHLMLPSKNC